MINKLLAFQRSNYLQLANDLANSSYHSKSPEHVAKYLSDKEAILIPVIEGEGFGLQNPVVSLINWMREELGVKTPIHLYIDNQGAFDKFLKLNEGNFSQITMYVSNDIKGTETLQTKCTVKDWNTNDEQLTNVIAISPACDVLSVIKNYKDKMKVDNVVFYQPWGWLDHKHVPKVDHNLHFVKHKFINRGILFTRDGNDCHYFSFSNHRVSGNATSPVKPHPECSSSNNTDTCINSLLTSVKANTIHLVTSYGLNNLVRPFDVCALSAIVGSLAVVCDRPVVIFLTNEIPENLLYSFNLLSPNEAINVADLEPQVYVVNYGFTSRIKEISENSLFMVGEGANTANEAVSKGVPMFFLTQPELALKRFELSPKQSPLAQLEQRVRGCVEAAYQSLLSDDIQSELIFQNFVYLEDGNIARQFYDLIKPKFNLYNLDEHVAVFDHLFSVFLLWGRQLVTDYGLRSSSEFSDFFKHEACHISVQDHCMQSTLFQTYDEILLQQGFNENFQKVINFLKDKSIEKFCLWQPDNGPLSNYFTNPDIKSYAECVQVLQNRESRNSHLVTINTLRHFEDFYPKSKKLLNDFQTLINQLPLFNKPDFSDDQQYCISLMQEYITEMKAINDTLGSISQQLSQVFLPQEFKEARLERYLNIYLESFSRTRVTESSKERWDQFWEVAKGQHSKIKRLHVRYKRWFRETFPSVKTLEQEWVPANNQIKFGYNGQILEGSYINQFLFIEGDFPKSNHFKLHIFSHWLVRNPTTHVFNSLEALKKFFDEDIGSVSWTFENKYFNLL
ncbi:hypothetical protein DID76_03030 [Candidatus Marinamargulisbacteria bacterium SCGC AG-414-C22]|nr:hypothetical protein DID76_03030 [Candidatus Marinamargulisbacteria bacterium SCGC AG-414-C22]